MNRVTDGGNFQRTVSNRWSLAPRWYVCESWLFSG